MELNDILFILGFIMALPFGIMAALANKTVEKIVFFLLVFSTTNLFSPISASLFYATWYRGTTRGFSLDIIDFLAIILLFVVLFSPNYKNIRFNILPFNSLLMILLIVIGLISIFFSASKLYGFYELVKWIRFLLIYIICVNYLMDTSKIKLALTALLSSTFVEIISSLYQRYIEGFIRINGTMDHYNLLSSFSALLGCIYFVLLIDSSFPPHNKKIYILAFLGSFLCILFSLSRGALAFFSLTIFLTIIISMIRKLTTKKIISILIIFSLAIPVFLKSFDTIAYRFIEAPASSGESRKDYISIAKLMIQDHPFTGIGLNNFSESTVNIYSPKTGLNRNGTPAHNIYYLTFAEVGLFGFILHILIWLRFIFLGLRTYFLKSNHYFYSLSFGIAMSFIAFAGISTLEWVYRTTYIFLLYNILAAIMVSAVSQKNIKPLLPK